MALPEPPGVPRPSRAPAPDADPGRAFWPVPRPPLAESLRARLADLVPKRAVGIAVIVVVALVVGLVAYQAGVGSGAGAGARPGRSATGAGASGRASTGSTPGTPGVSVTPSTGDVVVVHVAGAVHTPGVVELHAGARVVDAIEATGGALPDADLDRINLAARLVDGQRVLVSRKGEPTAPGDGLETVPGAAGPAPLVNLNTATATELDTLPGIGPTLAQAIIAERTRRGGFRSVNELRDVRGIGEARFADIKSLVTL